MSILFHFLKVIHKFFDFMMNQNYASTRHAACVSTYYLFTQCTAGHLK